MDSLRIYCFGSPRVEVNAQPVNLPRRKGVALLIYLALTGQTQQRDTLATIFWPESSQKAARSALRRELHNLQAGLGPGWLSSSRSTVGLSPSADVWVDALAFQQQIAAGKGENSAETIPHLTEAVDLYQNDFLAGFTFAKAPQFDEWSFFEGEQLRRQLAQALRQLTDQHTQQATFEQAIVYAQRQLALDTLHEAAHRNLMRLYAFAGQQAAALRQYDECVRILDDELGVEPEPETVDLHNKIRTRQLAQPTRAVLVQAPQQSAEPIARKHNLPAQTTSFIGRETDLNAIIKLLNDANCRLLTLVGPGGIGKTRLALQTAQQILNAESSARYTDGIFFVSLVTASDDAQVVSAIASAIGYTFQGHAEPQIQLLNYLQAKRMLLILDNYEQLLEHADFLSAILQIAPTVTTILTTSREALMLQEEWLYSVDGFRVPATQAEAATNPAMQLFIERARRHDAGLQFDTDALRHVARICQLVDGLPLGIELAAAWVHSLSLAEIVEEIESDLDFLTTTKRGGPAHHRSIRTVLEQSWRLLSSAEKTAFCRLAYFRDGFTRQAAKRVTQTSTVVLAALVRKSIVTHNRNGRYRIHNLLRQFAVAKLLENSAEADTVAEQHSRYFGMWLQSLETKLLGADHVAILGEIEQELENIRSGWRWALTQAAANLPLVNRYVEPLFHFYDIRSRFQEGYDALQFALRQLEGISAEMAPLVLGRIGGRIGWFAFQIGRTEEAKTQLEHSVQRLREQGVERDLIFSLNYLGAVHRHLGNFDQARTLLQESQQYCTQHHDQFGLTIALNILGQIAYVQRDYEQARAYCEESLTIKRALGEERGTTFSLLYLGQVARAQGAYERARQLLAESMAISEATGDRRGVAIGLSNLAQVETALGDTARAKTLFEQSLGIYKDIYNLLGIVTTHIKLGDLAREAGNSAETTIHYRTALTNANHLRLSPQAFEALVGAPKRWLSQSDGQCREQLDTIAAASS